MTFSTAPRSRSPVLSICTQSENEDVLRAEIEAASTRQQRYKRHKTRHWAEPTIEEEEDTNDVEHDKVCNKCAYLSHAQEFQAHQSLRRSISTSLHGITGTVRGEFSVAKRFLKNTSLRPFNRMRSKSRTETASPPRRRPELEDVRLDKSYAISPAPAELSSDPLYQLEDNQRSSIQSDEYRLEIPTFPEYQNVMPVDHQADDRKTYSPCDLSSKAYSCDNCQLPIRGGDLYDFCALCRPSDRILCITCARQGRCQRHRSDRFSMDDVSIARSSPAPPYTRPPHADFSKMLVSAEGEMEMGAEQTGAGLNQNIHGDPRRYKTVSEPAGIGSLSMTSEENENLMNVLRKMMDSQDSPNVDVRERSLHDKEASLREQLAAVREERVAVKEQELLLREREHLSRERDAMVIRNLQTLVTIQELSRNGFIGSQFPSAKKTDDNRPRFSNEFLGRANSRNEQDSISLENLGVEHKPKTAVTEVLAQAEATINDLVLDDKHVRSHPGQKRKKENKSTEINVTQLSASSRDGRSVQRSPDEDDENDEDGSIHPKKQKQDSSDPENPQRIFACPYFKHDRARYSPRNVTEKHYRGCAGHFLHDIPRLKQHLRRVHWRPEHHCPRCFEVFTGPSQLTEHFERVQGCSKQECPFPEKMDKAQRQKIHVKRPKVSPETLWYDIYKVLFPGTPLPESPYAEEDEITPPSSASPSSTSPEEAAQRMIQIFNERLDKHRGQPGNGWLSSSEARQLLNSEIVESMSELFNNLSLDSNIPLDLAMQHAPSIIVSPVTPPLVENSPLASAQRPSKSPSQKSAKASHARCERRERQSAPILKEPKVQLSPALRGPAIVPMHVPAEKVSHDSMQQSSTRIERINHGQRDMPRSQTPLEEQTDQPIEHFLRNFPPTQPIDDGYDDQCDSFREGDDRQAMETMISVTSGFVQDTTNLQAPKPVRPRNLHPWAPVRLVTLEDSDVAADGTGTQQLQPNKSVASLVDSGYGSGNSEHPGPRVSRNDEDADMSDDISPLGHTPFVEVLELLQSSDEHANPWRSTEDQAYF